MRFSQRKGLHPIRTELQRDSMDDDLRNGLWNAYQHAWPKPERYVAEDDYYRVFFRLLWHNFFKRPMDTIPASIPRAEGWVRAWFFKATWNEVYDFVEYLLEFYARDNDDAYGELFEPIAQTVLKRELSAYRIVGTQLVEITDDNELASIEEALLSQRGGVFQLARDHLESASKLVFDRENPDFRNSIKESISAVEAVTKTITGDQRTTLGRALSVLKKQGEIHGCLADGFGSLYSWTSDADGIRHAMMDEPTCDFADAKYMLVACAAFMNYLIEKSTQSGQTDS